MLESKTHNNSIHSQRLTLIYTLLLIHNKRRRRNPGDWSYDNLSSSHIFDRGYTGHEHLDQFGLINMNGRVYDPQLGRFLSPDPYVTSPENPQNYNRYSYVLNNPMIYTDPSGYSVQPHPDDENWNYSPAHNDITTNLSMQGVDWRSGLWGQDLHFMFLSVSDYEYLYGDGSHDIYLRANGYLRDNRNWVHTNTESYGTNNWDGFNSNANWLSGANVIATKTDFQKGIDVDNAQMKAKLGEDGGGETSGNNNSPINEIAGITSLLSGTVNNFFTQTRLGSDIAYYLSNNRTFLNSAKYVKSVGYWAIGLGISTDVMMSYSGTQSWTETGINTTVTGVALYIGGWPGIAISLIYNGVKLQVEQYQNVPSHMDKHWRRYSPGPY